MKRTKEADSIKALVFADGELLSEYGADNDKLVQWIGLPFGDAVKLSYQELEILNNKTDITEVQTALFLYKGAHSRLIWDDNSVVTGIGQTQESLGSFVE